MKRLSFMVSMAMLISCIASCDSGSDAVSYGVGSLSLGLSANPSFAEKTRSVSEAEYKKSITIKLRSTRATVPLYTMACTRICLCLSI